MSTFNTTNKKSHLERTMFFDESVDIARYDQVKYNNFEKLTEKQQSFYWRPQEIVLSKDNKDFKALTPHEQRIYTLNLQRPIILDSAQGRAPSLAFLPICSLPELEVWIQTWAFFETIHSRSYTHILRNVYPDPGKVLDGILEIQELVDCAKDISEHYDTLINENTLSQLSDTIRAYAGYNLYEHKKALWLCLNAVNALEGIRFYATFATAWNFAEQKKMEGSAKIFKLIARDENIHLASTQQMIKLLPKDDPEFASIEAECKLDVEKIFAQVIEQEKAWVKFMFRDGSMIGLNERLLCDYIDWTAAKRMKAVGVEVNDLAKNIKSNPLPWTQQWISGADVQVAPQEVEQSSYTIGAVKQDVTETTFKGFEL